MAGMKTALGLALGIAAAGLLAACDNGPSAVRTHGQDKAAAAARGGDDGGSALAPGDGGAPAIDHRRDPVRLVAGKPFWSASRRYSAEENAQRAFERNGQAFGAKTEAQFVKQAHDFVDHPPAGALTLTRANGDTLFYDPKANVFAVTSKDGAPRTMFKPDNGMTYWQQQKDRESRSAHDSRTRRGPNGEA